MKFTKITGFIIIFVSTFILISCGENFDQDVWFENLENHGMTRDDFTISNDYIEVDFF